MYYLNARMYDPKIARFLQEDTYLGDPNDPLSLNLYTYCHNEPLMYSDPTGHIEINGRNFTPEEIGRHEYLLSKKQEDAVIRLHDVLKYYNTSLSQYEYNCTTGSQLDEIFHTNIWSPKYVLNTMGQYNNELLYNTLVLQDENLFNDLGETISNYEILSSYDIDRINREINSNPAYKSIIETVENERDEQQIKMAKTAGSLGVDFIPVVGNVKSGVELVTGQDYIAGEEVGTPSRVMAAVGIALPLVKKAKYLSEVGKVIKGLWEADEVGKDVSKVSKVVSEGTNDLGNVLTFNDDPVADANILIAASRGNQEAQKFLNANRGLISAGRSTYYEFLKGGKAKGGTRAAFTKLIKDYGISYVDDISYKDVIEEAKTLRKAFDGTGMTLRVMDSRQLAFARLKGIDFATNDIQLYKRAKDLDNLGIDIHYFDMYPGLGGAPSRNLINANKYISKGVSIP